MALFTDFFPTAGDQISNNNSTPVNSGEATVGNLDAMASTLELTFATALSTTAPDVLPVAGDIVSFSSPTRNYVGVVIGTPTATLVMLTVADLTGIANGNTVDVTFTQGGQTIVEGDNIVGGDLAIAGDSVFAGDVTASTFTGDLAGNATTATTLETTRTFSVSGDATAAAVNFNGSGNVDLSVDIDEDVITTRELADGAVATANIADTAVTTAKIANNAVTNDKMADNAINTVEIVDDAITAAKLGNVVTMNGGLAQATGGSLELAASVAGNNLTLTNGVLNVTAIDLNNAHAYTSTQTTADMAKADFITAFNTAGTAVNGINVAIGTELDPGDQVILTYNTSDVEIFIYTGNAETASADGTMNNIADAQLLDVTNQNNGVSSITPGSGLLGTAAEDAAVTLNVGAGTGITVNANDVAITDAGVGTTQLANLGVTTAKIANDAVTADKIADDVVGQEHINANVAGNGLSQATTGALQVATGDNIVIDADEVQLADNVDIAGTLDVTGAATLDSTLSVTGLANLDGGIEVATGTTNHFTVDGTNGNTDIAGTLDVTGATTLTGALSTSGNVTLGNDTTNDAIAVNGLSLTIEAASTAINSETITIGDGTDGTTTIAGASLTSATAGATSISTTTASNANLTLSAGGTGQLRIAGSGITNGTMMEPRGLAIGANGQIVSVSGGTSGAAFDLLVGMDANITTNSGGDLVVLPPITADRNLNFPSLPSAEADRAGISFEIANLSATGTGSGAFRWSVGAAGDIVMGTTLTEAFVLDDQTASFKFVYTNNTYGWVIVGAN